VTRARALLVVFASLALAVAAIAPRASTSLGVPGGEQLVVDQATSRAVVRSHGHAGQLSLALLAIVDTEPLALFFSGVPLVTPEAAAPAPAPLRSQLRARSPPTSI